jgi:Xaa-Pro aminopeptidase
MVHQDRRTPADEIRSRIEALKTALAEQQVDAALVIQKMDLFYFSGTIQQGQLYVPAAGEPVLMIRKSADRAKAESPIQRQVPLDRLSEMKRLISDQGLAVPRRLGLELDVLPANLYMGIQSLFEGTELVDVSLAVRRIRSVKSDYEIDRIREAARGADAVAAFVAGALVEGVPEVELAGKVEAEARRLGHQGFVRMRLWDHELFYGHLMAGPGAAVPGYLSSPAGGASLSPAVAQGPSLRPIRRGEPVLVDYAFAKNGYIADHTRIFAVGGLDDDLLNAHRAALEIQKALLEAIRPETPSGVIYDLAAEQAAERGLGDHFMGAEKGRIRFVGHGIGLELDEFPFLAKGQKMPLKAGMVIALEPRLIFPGRGVVGIENTHVITENGAEQITRFPDKIAIV